MVFSVDVGLIFDGGETLCEITIETFWYAGVFGRTLACWRLARISLRNG
jgi:hypothetical protein